MLWLALLVFAVLAWGPAPLPALVRGVRKDGLLRGYHFRRQRLVAGNAQITRKAGMRAAGNQYPDTLSRFDSIGRRGQGDDDVHAAVRLHLAATHFHTIDPLSLIHI